MCVASVAAIATRQSSRRTVARPRRSTSMRRASVRGRSLEQPRQDSRLRMLVAVETVAAAPPKATMCEARPLDAILRPSRESRLPTQRSRIVTWPCCQNPGRSSATSRRAVARKTQVLGRTGFDVQGRLALFSSSRSVERTHTGGRREQEFGQAQEAAQAEGTEDAQAAPKREARDQEGRLRPHLPGSQVET